MDFSFDTEQEALRESVHAMLADAYESTEVRREVTSREPGFSDDTWQQLARMGVLGLPFSEDDGGMGAGPVEVGLVAEEIGRVLAPEPFVESVVLAGGLVAGAADNAQRSNILSRLSDGSLRLAAALYEPGQRSDVQAHDVHASQDGQSWTVRGVKEPVLHGASADALIVSAALPDGATGLFYVDSQAQGLERTSYRTHDGGRAAHISFADTPADILGSAADRSDVLATAVAKAQIAYSHEAVGAMETALSSTTEYLKTRKQFGVTLNTFQALTFRAADMYVSLEQIRSMVLWASMIADAGGDVVTAASRAKALLRSTGRHIGQEAVQLHGGIGMTAEYSVGHYMNRLTAIEHLLGDGDEHILRLADRVGEYGVLDPIAS